MTNNLIEWQYEFDGKHYGSALSKGDTNGVNNKKLMHQYIDVIAKQMHETLDALKENQ